MNLADQEAAMLQYIKVISIVIIFGCHPAVANELYIEQAGASFDLDVVQDGKDNYLKLDIDGNDTTFKLVQEGDNHKTSWVSYWGSGATWGGDIDGTDNEFDITQYNNIANTSTGGTIGFHIQGNNNALALAQGCAFASSSSTTCTSGMSRPAILGPVGRLAIRHSSDDCRKTKGGFRMVFLHEAQFFH